MGGSPTCDTDGVSGPDEARGRAVAPGPARRPVLRVGCPVWAHPPWVGRFLSPGNRGRELAEYARWCNAVEGNTTFYAEPAARTVDRWADQAPADFRFAFKLPRTITHERRLVDTGAVVSSFLQRLEPLGERVGPLQIQLPPSFGPESFGVLTSFVASLARERTWVVELRHHAFFSGGPAHRRLDDLLERHGVGRVVLDTRPLYAAPMRSDASFEERASKPRLPVHPDGVGVAPVVRVIGEDRPEGTLAGLRAWVDLIVGWLDEGRTPYLFAHQPENLDSPALARRIHDEVRSRVPELAPLPDPLPVAPRDEIVGQDCLF